MKKFIRSKKTGVIFSYNQRLLGRPEFEVVTEQEAFPERFAPVNLAAREQKVDLTVPEEAAVAPPFVSPELQADASREFGSPTATKVARKAKPAPVAKSFESLGLEGEF